MDLTMGRVLQGGVITCCAVMLVGAVLYLLQNGDQSTSYSRFLGEPAALESIPAIFHAALKGSAKAIIQLAALLMIATPVMRVVFAVIGFARMKDWKFTAISLTVLALLTFGFFTSR